LDPNIAQQATEPHQMYAAFQRAFEKDKAPSTLNTLQSSVDANSRVYEQYDSLGSSIPRTSSNERLVTDQTDKNNITTVFTPDRAKAPNNMDSLVINIQDDGILL
jgi:hypothetical protein